MKIQCSCGSKYAFDLTPEMGRSPIKFVCKNCGVDSSDMVNQLVREQLGLGAPESSGSIPGLAPPPTREPVVARVKSGDATQTPPQATPVAAAPPVPPRARPPSLRVADHTAAAAATESAPVAEAPQLCVKHPGQLTTNRCRVCQKPICPKCMELFGYVCSALCKGKAESQGIRVPVYAHQKLAAESKQWRNLGIIIVTTCVLLISAAGFWIWYKYSGSLPKMVLTARFQDPSYSGQSRFVGPNQLVLLHAGTLSRHDIKEKRRVWSQPVIDKKKIAEEAARIYEKQNAGAKPTGFESEAFRPLTLAERTESLEQAAAEALRLYVRGENIWVSSADQVVRYDWQTGQPVKEIPRTGRVVPNGEELLVISPKGTGQEVAHIDLASGNTRSEEIGGAASATLMAGTDSTSQRTPSGRPNPPVASKPQPIQVRLARPAVQAANENQQRALAEMKDPPETEARVAAISGTADGGLLFPSGNGFLQLLIRPFAGASSGTAAGTGDRFQLTLRRFGATGGAEWTGEAVGKPQLFPLQTVDVLVAGKAVWVFDKANKKLWESKLNSELVGGFRAALSGETPPFGEGPLVEKGDTLYLFDAGELTAFDLASGNPRWHLATTSIAGLHFDPKGMIYVNSANQASGILQSQLHIDIPEGVPHMVQKIEAKTGRVVWSADREGLVRYLAGQFLYTVASQHGDTAEEEDVDLPVLNTGMQKTPHVRIKRLDPGTGKVIWEHYHRHSPLDVRFEKNTIHILCRKEMRVLKYLAF